MQGSYRSGQQQFVRDAICGVNKHKGSEAEEEEENVRHTEEEEAEEEARCSAEETIRYQDQATFSKTSAATTTEQLASRPERA